MGVNMTTIAYLRVLIIEIGSTIILMVVEAQAVYKPYMDPMGIGDGHPTFKGKPWNWHIKPYHEVDDHPYHRKTMGV